MAVVESAVWHPIKGQQEHDIDKEIPWSITFVCLYAPYLKDLNLHDVVDSKQHVTYAEQDGDSGQDFLLFLQVSS